MYHGPETLLSSVSESSPLIIISASVCKVDIAPPAFAHECTGAQDSSLSCPGSPNQW